MIMHPSTHRSSQGRSDLDPNLDLPTHAVSTYRSTHLDKVFGNKQRDVLFSPRGDVMKKRRKTPAMVL
jgi:hypothetical protein